MQKGTKKHGTTFENSIFLPKTMYLDSPDGLGQLKTTANAFLLIRKVIPTQISSCSPFNYLKNMQNDEKNTLNRKMREVEKSSNFPLELKKNIFENCFFPSFKSTLGHVLSGFGCQNRVI